MINEQLQTGEMITLAYVSPDSPRSIVIPMKRKYPSIEVRPFYWGDSFIEALRDGYRPEIIVADRQEQGQRSKHDFVDAALELYQPVIIHSGPVVSGLRLVYLCYPKCEFEGNKSFDRKDFLDDELFPHNLTWSGFRSEVLDKVIEEIEAQRRI